MGRLTKYPGLPYYVFGGLFLTLSVGYLRSVSDTPATVGFRGFLPILIAGGLLYAGYLFRSLSPPDRLVVHAGLIMGVGGFFAAAVAGYIVWLESTDFTVTELTYPLIVAGATGALLATPITYYYTTATQRLVDLEGRYADAERMRKQLSVLDRVLRHNLRNELNIIAGWMEELPRTDDPQTKPDARHIVERHITRLEDLSETARLIRQVFDTDTRVHHDVPSVVETVLADLNAGTRDVPIDTEMPATARVLAHPHLDVAICELVENAIRHNDTDTLTVEVSVTPAAVRPDGTRMCRIDVRDTGQGIPQLEIEALTQPEETPLSHGRGLGLWLVSAIVEQSAGHLEFPDTEHGTAVRLWLPPA